MPNQNFTGLEKIDLASADLHAPVEVSLAVYMRLPDGVVGTMRATMPPGQIPSRADLKLLLDGFTDASGEIPGAPRGARLLNRSEFVAHITKRELGAPFNLPADAQYAALPSEIPHAMLVHAICGAGFGKDAYATPIEMTERGLAEFTGNQWNEDWSWDAAALAKQPDDVLLALYKRVTA